MSSRLRKILEKAATNKAVAQKSGYNQTRQGRRPIRVSNLLKKAEEGKGPEETPGVFKPSAAPNTNFAQKQLNKSTAEVGPLGNKTAAMESQMLKNDPLIQYLKKTAAEDEPETLISPEGILADNLDNMPVGPTVEKLKAEPVEATKEVRQEMQGAKTYLQGIFDHTNFRKKYTEKDNENRIGVVDDVLGI